MIKNLVLDIGNVICEWNPERLCAMGTDNVEVQKALMDVSIKHSDWLDLDRGVISVEQATKNAQERTDIDGDLVAGVYANTGKSLTIIDATVVAMNRAHKAGIPIYILSNMQQVVWDYLRETHACFGLCAGVVVSCEAKLNKPDPAIYEHLCEKFELKSSECIFIDDMQENIDAAERCGWQAKQLPSVGDSEIVLNGIIDDILKTK